MKLCRNGHAVFWIALLYATNQCCFADKISEYTPDMLVEAFYNKEKPPGLSITVAHSGKIIWSRGLGYVDLENKVKVDPSKSKFRIGSVAKPWTSYALFKLYQEKKISLTSDVREYVPSFPRKKYTFTVQQLAGHFSGIRHYKKGEAYLDTHYPRLKDGLVIFKDDDLLFEPGLDWKYSSYGYNLLGVVVEAASGLQFDEYMDKHVFQPLNMNDTVADELRKIISNRVRYYGRDENGVFNEKEVDNYFKLPAGGFLSTSEDMARFGMAMLSNTYLNEESKRMMWTSQKTKSGKLTDYGLGWRVVTDEDGIEWVGHGGGSIGGTTQFWIFPSHDFVITSASNLTELNYGRVLLDIRNWFFKDIEKNKAGNNDRRL